MSQLKENAKWNKIGAISLIIILVITELIIWSGIFDASFPNGKGKLGSSAIAFAVFGGMAAFLLARARTYNYLARREDLK